MPLTRVTMICAWLATLTFMSGFLVFIVQPWSSAETQLSHVPGHYVAEAQVKVLQRKLFHLTLQERAVNP